MIMDKIELVKKGYNQIAHLYNKNRDSFHSDKYLYKFIDLLPKQAEVLDIGCGDGLPVDQILIKKGFLVHGIDISSVQIDLARKNCPTGNYQVKDMMDLESNEFQVGGVVSFYALFHIPRSEHLQMLKKINSFLPTGGFLLITMGDKDFEGEHDLYGAKMYSSHFGPTKNRQLIEQAGFEIMMDEIDHSARETHQILICKKNF